nr:MAG TPA: hypothetical protein [Caudoviricetes sp.]
MLKMQCSGNPVRKSSPRLHRLDEELTTGF